MTESTVPQHDPATCEGCQAVRNIPAHRVNAFTRRITAADAPVESAASDGEVGSAPVGGAHAPGGKNATGGGQEPAHSTAATVAEACRSPQRGASDEAPLGASTSSGGCTLDDAADARDRGETCADYAATVAELMGPAAWTVVDEQVTPA